MTDSLMKKIILQTIEEEIEKAENVINGLEESKIDV